MADQVKARSLISLTDEFDAVKENATTAVKGLFPIIGKQRSLRLDDAWVDDNKDTGDLKGQLQAKLEEKTWGVPLMGRVKLVDNSTGRVLDSKEVRLADLPKPTPRLAYIVGGQEFQVDRQWRLKPGVYSRVKDNGELEAHINTTGGERLSVEFDPTNRKFNLVHGGSTIPLFPVLRALGADSEDIRRAWGSEIFNANAIGNYEKSIRKLYKADTGKEAKSLDEATRHVRDSFYGKKLDAGVTKTTLGQGVDKLDQQALTLTSKKLLSVARGDDEPDDRDALPFKNLHATEDYVGEKIKAFGTSIRRHLGNVVDRESRVEPLIYPGMLDKAVAAPFTDSVLSRIPSQDNPLEFLNGHTRTSPLGYGGVSDLRMINEEMKGVGPTHLAYLDPVNTPEGEKVGITTHLTLGASKAGNDVVTPVYDVKTKKIRTVNPSEFVDKVVALPDSVRWEGPEGSKHPVPVASSVRVAGPKNEITTSPWKDVDYVIPSKVSLFSPATNMIPFVQNDDGARVGMADRHLTQSVPLKYRETPLVQASPKEDRALIELPGALASHKSPVDGTVSRVGRGVVEIRDRSGKTHEIQIYDHFPLNDKKAGIHSEPIVAVGDRVSKGQVVADSNFTRDGKLALGVNLRVGYIPIPGKTFEDGVVVSETAAKKLTSMHLHRHAFSPTENTRVGKSTFSAYYPTRYNNTQLSKLDDDGVIREGEEVKPGDPISVALQKQVYSSEAQAMAKLKKSLVKPYSDASTEWDHDQAGRVVRVHKLPDGRAKVFISTEEPAQVADKISGVHGNKGTIVEIRPDEEMPKTSDGKPIEVALNPYGVTGRMNVGQIYEVAAAKISQKTGKPYLVSNFDSGVDYGDKIREEMKQHGIKDTEEVFDPKTGERLGDVLVGPAYLVKQRHQVERKIIARSGGPGFAYDLDRQPRRGGTAGAQSLGGLGNLALLAHGARNVMREAATYKSDVAQQDELWRSIQMGMPLPPPKPTFAQKKFENYLFTLGVKLKKDGTRIQMVPTTDQDVLRVSAGEVQKPNLVLRGHDLAPEPGGLFDPTVTGGVDGTNMSHIRLPEPIPNPFFEKGVMAITGLKQDDLLDILAGKKGLRGSELVSSKEPGAVTGSKAIQQTLKSIDVNKEIKTSRERLNQLSGQALDRENRKLRYLEAIKSSGLRPDEAYMTSVVPVMPPNMRPIVPLPSGDLATDPLNETYKALGITINSYKKADPDLPESRKGRLRKEIYTSLAALQGVGAGYKRVQGGETQGIMDIFTQPTAKFAWIQSRLFKQRQDLSGRSVIIPDPDLQLDEIGVPHRIASEIYKPFTVRELTRSGYSPLEAEKMIQGNDPMAEAALHRVMDQRPVLAKRDPVLHKYGIQAFKPRLDKGYAIKIHPLVTQGYNADFDGDTMSLYVPVTAAAVSDARKMMPSANLLNPATGKPVYTPSNEMSLGLYRMTTIGEDKGAKNFSSIEEALAAHSRGEVKWDTIKIGGRPTTVGRVRLYVSLPESARKEAILFDPDHVWDSKRTNSYLKDIAKDQPQAYADTAQKLMDLGSKNVYENAFSLSADDFIPDKKSRENAFSWARSQVAKLPSGLKPRERNQKIADIWLEAGEKMEKEHWAKASISKPKLFQMTSAGVKPSKEQYKQVVLSPILVTGIKGKLVLSPQEKSYSEGVDTGDFFVHGMAARASMVKKTQEVRDPGWLTKQTINTVADSVVSKEDCGTSDGVSMSVDHPDVDGRYLAKGIGAGPVKLGHNALITPTIVDHLRKAGVQTVVVRSPLKCRLPQGVCQKCYGLGPEGHAPEIGTNVGVISGEAIGERSTQLFMKAFHTGGAVEKGGGTAAVSQFDRIDQVLRLPKEIPNSAVLAEASGLVRRVRPDPAGGHRISVESEGREIEHHVPGTIGLRQDLKVGSQVSAGQALSLGAVNMHDLLRTGGLEQVQNQITHELDNVYRSQGIRRRNLEVLTRGVTNLGVVDDPGDNPLMRRGDHIPISNAQAWNDRKVGRPVRVTPVLKGIGFAPLDMHEDWLAKLHHERLKDTLVDAALEGHQANISGLNPFSSLAFNPDFGQGISGIPGAY